MRRPIAFLFGVCALAATACATSPTGRHQLMIVPESYAISASRSAYQSELAPYARSGRLDDDPALHERVVRITDRLVAQAIAMRPETRSWDWSVRVIDDPKTVNAWAMAGGKMAIYSGLVRQLDATDDEIAQVMGHEMAHALARHTAEKMSTALMTELGVAGVAVATGSGAAGSLASSAAQLAIKLPNSRAAESEADQIGIELAAKAGYDPRAAVTLWQKMEKNSEGKTPPEFLSTHPSPEHRTEKLAAMVPSMLPYYEAARARAAGSPAPR